MSYPFSITKWWSTYTNAGVFSLHNEGVISDDRPIDLKQTTFNLYHQSTFNVTDKFSLELSVGLIHLLFGVQYFKPKQTGV